MFGWIKKLPFNNVAYPLSVLKEKEQAIGLGEILKLEGFRELRNGMVAFIIILLILGMHSRLPHLHNPKQKTHVLKPKYANIKCRKQNSRVSTFLKKERSECYPSSGGPQIAPRMLAENIPGS